MIVATDECNELRKKIEEDYDRIGFYCKIFKIEDPKDQNNNDNDNDNNNNISLLNRILKESGCNEIADKLIQINFEKAKKLCRFLISSELVYGMQYFEDDDIDVYLDLFFSYFDGDSQFYTNIDSEDMDLNKSYGMELLTYATLSSGLIIISDKKCGIIYQEGED